MSHNFYLFDHAQSFKLVSAAVISVQQCTLVTHKSAGGSVYFIAVLLIAVAHCGALQNQVCIYMYKSYIIIL